MVQTAFGERLGRGQTYVSNVELGIRRLDLVELRDYCAALGIGLPQLIERWEMRIEQAPKPERPTRRRKA